VKAPHTATPTNPMRISVLFFARAREATDLNQLSVDIEDGTTAGQLLEQLVRQYPKLQEIRSCLVLAVNQEYADETTTLTDRSEVALIPPISGG
jgi:molybdopterin converting factor subunit 1